MKKNYFKHYLEIITTGSFTADNHVGTIRKIERLPNGKIKYHYAGDNDIIVQKNPDGSYVNRRERKRKRDRLGDMLLPIQQRPVPTMEYYMNIMERYIDNPYKPILTDDERKEYELLRKIYYYLMSHGYDIDETFPQWIEKNKNRIDKIIESIKSKINGE